MQSRQHNAATHGLRQGPRRKQTPAKKKRLRPPRGSGLRSRTGCITCRLRHRKCDETRPICGNCASSGRECDWPSVAEDLDNNTTTATTTNVTAQSTEGPDSSFAFESASQTEGLETLPPLALQDADVANNEDPTLVRRAPGPLETTQPGISPGSTHVSDSSATDRAPSRWLNLLIHDIEREDFGLDTASLFNNATSIQFPRVSWGSGDGAALTVPSIDRSEIADRPQDFDMSRWQCQEPAKPISMTKEEMELFQNYVTRSARWLDIFDSRQHFSTHVSRLALRDEGLLNAILALSAQHTFHEDYMKDPSPKTSSDQAVQFYYKTLCYVQKAMQFTSYSQSEELLATALIVSTYEMLDESTEGWSRHLKGVFWIQRSQSVNGLSPGIRQAVWWAWLRQEQWAAFLERRKSTSYWMPPTPIADQTQDELADYAAIMLRSAVDFAARRDGDRIIDVQFLANRMQTAKGILQELNTWRSCLGPPFEPLPHDEALIDPDIPNATRSVFKPIWIHPPKFAVALQVFHFARILIYMNQPILDGLSSERDIRRELHESVAAICGLAITIQDEAYQISSSQCLFGAGLCEHSREQRNAILELIYRCERRSGWPTNRLRRILCDHWDETRLE